MGQPKFLVRAEDLRGLNSLFEMMVDSSDQLKSEDFEFNGISSKAITLGSGLPEISELIVSLAGAGTFSAIAAVLKKYFDKRPNGTVKFSLKSGDVIIEFTATNADAAAVTAGMKSLATMGKTK